MTAVPFVGAGRFLVRFDREELEERETRMEGRCNGERGARVADGSCRSTVRKAKGEQ